MNKSVYSRVSCLNDEKREIMVCATFTQNRNKQGILIVRELTSKKEKYILERGKKGK